MRISNVNAHPANIVPLFEKALGLQCHVPQSMLVSFWVIGMCHKKLQLLRREQNCSRVRRSKSPFGKEILEYCCIKKCSVIYTFTFCNIMTVTV